MRDFADEDLDAERAADKRQRDVDDLQNEVAGNETGRISRFLSAEDDRSVEGKRRKREKQEAADRRLMDLMKDPEYAALHHDLGDKLRDAETGADETIAAMQAHLRAIEAEIADIEARAAKGPDGAPVFRTAHGRVVHADGEELPPEIAAGIIWPDNAPSAEDYFAARAERDSAVAKLNEWQSYRNDVLGGIRHRYDDKENPMTKDDLKDALDQIETARPLEATLNTDMAQETKPLAAPQAFPSFS
ncbi:hypothetical protein TRP8649_02299 [Pelagimonas phthalicica]|uniref:Uncharacterized protein n=1 Tax=Pelagimonas phthalicica TaxID=1037362 RepID=A0A238JDA4_9RHOB|nr:hypothetical protein [Pelagimonas phthalicica]TDS91137.1 hypothetical protein CLV87_2301 [Pelagimonas phthalicica]SMX28184.1 hypothetical protein TRP8649_02299 [Pelagimonas phthalicica]